MAQYSQSGLVQCLYKESSHLFILCGQTILCHGGLSQASGKLPLLKVVGYTPWSVNAMC